MLPLEDAHLEALSGVNDSKQLTPLARERLVPLIIEHALACGIGLMSSETVDEAGIIQATKRAMTAALDQLRPAAEYLLIDGRIRLGNIPLPQQSIIRGDQHSLSIAAASILAKVTRDRYMIEMDGRFPAYGFALHKGYGTRRHLAALFRHGPTPIHRLSFAPLRRTLV
jgi:ribonuclease HII